MRQKKLFFVNILDARFVSLIFVLFIFLRDYESSDDEMSFPRKLKAIRGKEKDPDLGKVVAVDFGDRRKRDNWYPGLVVPQPAQSTIKIAKEEYLIRSFKDGK